MEYNTERKPLKKWSKSNDAIFQYYRVLHVLFDVRVFYWMILD